MQRRDSGRADDQRWNQRESSRNHFDAPGMAEVLHELFFEGGYLLLLTEADYDVSKS